MKLSKAELKQWRVVLFQKKRPTEQLTFFNETASSGTTRYAVVG